MCRLTKREIEILQLAATGRSSKQIADELCVSKRTVDFHFANIYDKMDVENRWQALLLGAKKGYCTLPVAA